MDGRFDALRTFAGSHPRTAIALRLAGQIYRGKQRSQGTPYIDHPFAVATILLVELGLSDPEQIACAILHDALEVEPLSGPAIRTGLGPDILIALESMTPDHRLERRKKRPTDAFAWREKLRALHDDLFLVRIADRLHNLIELPMMQDPARSHRYCSSLVRNELPLADKRDHPAIGELAGRIRSHPLLSRAPTHSTP